MSTTPANIPGFLWDPQRKKYFKESKELRERLEALSVKSNRVEMEQKEKRKPATSLLQALEKEALVLKRGGLGRNPVDLLFQRIQSRTRQPCKVNIFNNQTNYGTIIDFLLVEESAWILLTGGILIKSLLPQDLDLKLEEEHRHPQAQEECRVEIQEMIAGLLETTCLIHIDIPSGNLVGAVNFEKNIIRILPTENDCAIPEVVLRVKRDIAMNCCEFDANWNCLIGSKGSFHRLNWANGGTTQDAFSLKSKSDILSILPVDDLVITGFRNGSVGLTDTRAGQQHCSFTSSSSSSPVTCLRKTNSNCFDNNVFTGHLDGSIRLFDLRFVKSPMKSFQSTNRIKPFKFSIVENDVLLAGNDCGLLEAFNIASNDRILSIRWNNKSDTDDTRPFVAWDWKNRGCWLVNEISDLLLFPSTF